MSSRRPTPHRFKNYLTWLSKEVPDAKPLHSLFKENGYTTVSIGKIFHHAGDHKAGWSEKPIRNKQLQYFDPQLKQQSISSYQEKYPDSKKKVKGPSIESADVDETQYGDGQSATVAIEKLEKFAKSPDQPFFLAVGFYKPHLPFTAPKKFWDLYDRGEIEVAANSTKPVDVPKVALHTSGELRAYSDIPPTGPVDEAKAKELIHGYRACVSFMDAQVGRVLDKLRQTGLEKNTIVVLWSDHGWQLGEHGLWNKHSCFETSMWVPLIVSSPGDDSIRRGSRVSGIVELIDLYPTLCELAGIKAPNDIDGQSFVSLLQDPNAEGKPYAIGRYRFGDTIRTREFRYTEFRGKADGKNGEGPVGAGKVIGRMLFSSASDPDENENVVRKSHHKAIVEDLSASLNLNKGR